MTALHGGALLLGLGLPSFPGSNTPRVWWLSYHESQDGALLRTFIRALKEAGLHPVGIANATASDLQVR